MTEHKTRTPESIQELKESWLKDPYLWDIEDTPGFEAHREELLAWRKENEAERQKNLEERDEKRIEKVMLATGLGRADRETLLALRAFDEIEWDVWQQHVEGAQTHLMLAQVRATLLQAAQLKRIADALERMQDGDTLVNLSRKLGGEQ